MTVDVTTEAVIERAREDVAELKHLLEREP
jgi:hypothetical protein